MANGIKKGEHHVIMGVNVISDSLVRSHIKQGIIKDVKHLFPLINTNDQYAILSTVAGIKFYSLYVGAVFFNTEDKTWQHHFTVDAFFDAINGADEDRMVWLLKYGKDLPIWDALD